jgi:putative endonuclease
MTQLTALDLNRRPAAGPTREVGDTGERLASQFLVRRGMRLVCSNFTVPIGRNLRGATVTGEIDLVALDGDVLCFVEVKTRSSAEFGSPVKAVDLRKQRQIIRAARIYRRVFNLDGIKFRYDAVAVVLGETPRIEHFKGFWSESKFGRKNWDRHY